MSLKCSIAEVPPLVLKNITAVMMIARIVKAFIRLVSHAFATVVVTKPQSDRSINNSIFSPDCEYLHIPLTLPNAIRFVFRENRFLLNELFRCAANIFFGWTKRKGIEVGISCDLHTYYIRTQVELKYLYPRVSHSWRVVSESGNLETYILQSQNH
jgi:hypothetical protein